MALGIRLPAMLRKNPERKIRFSYQVPDQNPPQDPGDRVAGFCSRHDLGMVRSEVGHWQILIHGSTRVFGFVAREIDEEVSVHVAPWAEGNEIVVSCEPRETHSAHAAGAVGVLVFAAAAWIFGGFVDGAVVALAITAAGWLVVEVTRHWGLDALESRVRALTTNLGKAFWPGRSGQLIERHLPH